MSDIRERRIFNFEMRAEQDEEHGKYIAGRPIVFGQETDLGCYREEIMPGALDACDLRDVRLLVNHNTDMIPLARSRNNTPNSTMQLMPVPEGLDFRANLDTEKNTDASAAYSAVDRGDMSGMSFMFTVDADRWEDIESDHPKRFIERIGKIFEISICTFPAYEGTSVQAASEANALESAKATLESARAAARAKADEGKESPEGDAPAAPAFERCTRAFEDMDSSELTERAKEIESIECPEAAEERAAISAELEARRAAAREAEEKRKQAADDTKVDIIKDLKKEEKRTMTEFAEIRKSDEYKAAFLRYLKSNNDAEIRALLSTNGTNPTASLTGYVPVPEFLESEIKTAWEEHQLLGLVKHTYMKGNVKIGFELTAGGAVVHAEGTDKPDEEVITLGTVTITAESLKKWITVSDEAIEGTTVDTMGYLYKEIAQRIIELAEEILVGKITAAPTESTSTAPAVQEVELPNTGLAIDTIVNAVALLSGQAKDLHIAMNRGTRAKLISLQMGANYAVDVFDGLKDRIVITDKLPNIGDAEEGDAVIIIGDFGYGAQANFPNGEEMGIKVDNLSLAEKDLVKLVGRQYVGMAVVAENAFVRVVTYQD